LRGGWQRRRRGCSLREDSCSSTDKRAGRQAGTHPQHTISAQRCLRRPGIQRAGSGRRCRRCGLLLGCHQRCLAAAAGHFAAAARDCGGIVLPQPLLLFILEVSQAGVRRRGALLQAAEGTARIDAGPSAPLSQPQQHPLLGLLEQAAAACGSAASEVGQHGSCVRGVGRKGHSKWPVGGGQAAAAGRRHGQRPCSLHPAPCRCPTTHLLLSSAPVRVLRSNSRYFGRADESWALAGSSSPPPAGKGSIERCTGPRSSREVPQKLRDLGPARGLMSALEDW
jgi:hypothetical protein